MADVIMVAILVAFFGVATLFVRACDAIIGADETIVPADGAGDLGRGEDSDARADALGRPDAA